jgi:hypothetical protein
MRPQYPIVLSLGRVFIVPKQYWIIIRPGLRIGGLEAARISLNVKDAEQSGSKV